MIKPIDRFAPGKRSDPGEVSQMKGPGVLVVEPEDDSVSRLGCRLQFRYNSVAECIPAEILWLSGLGGHVSVKKTLWFVVSDASIKSDTLLRLVILATAAVIGEQVPVEDRHKHGLLGKWKVVNGTNTWMTSGSKPRSHE
jgi:hypothetical protein